MAQKTLSAELTYLLDYAIQQKASDIHIMPDVAPMVRIDGSLLPVDRPVVTAEKSNELMTDLIGATLLDKISQTRKEIDFSFGYQGLRFRTNVYYQKGVLAGSFRLLPNEVPDFDQLGIPGVVAKMLAHNQGLIIVSGPTGHGKSTTLAAIINRIASERRAHIITIEDPIEYVFSHKKSVVTQREVGTDTPSFGSALRASLREDPDVVLVGEMRDLETMEAALQLAETGHLVLTTLHTNSASQTADRIIDVFPTHQQAQVRTQLSAALIGVISQRLIPKTKGGRVLATEVMMANPAVRALIREGKTHQLPNLIQTSASEGMIGLDKSLAELVGRGDVSIDDALAWSLDPKSLKLQIY
jgi:twitching motility protein PilT